MKHTNIAGRRIPVVGTLCSDGQLRFDGAEGEATFKLTDDQKQRLSPFTPDQQLAIAETCRLVAAQCVGMIRRESGRIFELGRGRMVTLPPWRNADGVISDETQIPSVPAVSYVVQGMVEEVIAQLQEKV